MARGNSPFVLYTLESNANQYPVGLPEGYPIPKTKLYEVEDPTTFSSNYQLLSIDKKKDHLVVARNNLELFSTILSYEVNPKPLKFKWTYNA
ncbi:hypothetical protein Fmac_005180 [Flemingia macrophylla]|uniref:Uncharacterized protein n=1 Tax=Flemingia macrophylla TaxID=520843 RepID=A0ABD1N9M8_9FABA